MSSSPELKEFLEKNLDNSNYTSVYHYTDIDALLGIIENNELWFTNRNYMNDVYDEKYAKCIFDKFLRSINSNTLAEGSALDDKLYQNTRNSYIFSTSTEKDLANQWLCYGNGSVCIEFNKNELEKLIAEFTAERTGNQLGIDYRDDFLSSHISYVGAGDEKVENIKIFLKEKYCNDSSKSGDKNTGSQQEIIYAHYDWQAICGFIKQKAFAAEKEFRFLLLSNQKPSFRIRNGRLIPFLKVKSKDKNSILPITSIVIGPKNHDEYLRNTFRKLLENNGYGNFGIEQSSLSLR
jgi:hypothetical protein